MSVMYCKLIKLIIIRASTTPYRWYAQYETNKK